MNDDKGPSQFMRAAHILAAHRMPFTGIGPEDCRCFETNGPAWTKLEPANEPKIGLLPVN